MLSDSWSSSNVISNSESLDSFALSSALSFCAAVFLLVALAGDRYFSLNFDDGSCCLRCLDGLTSDLLTLTIYITVQSFAWFAYHFLTTLLLSLDAFFLRWCHRTQFTESIRLKGLFHNRTLSGDIESLHSTHHSTLFHVVLDRTFNSL